MSEPSDPKAKSAPEKRDWRDTVFLPKTDFPMKAGLPQKEPGILARWQEQDLYRRLREARAGAEKFILHDGPPYANGNIHVGHALNHILKDMVVRTQSGLGKDAPYVPGWDCHGLPIEWKVEEEYRKKKRNKDEVPAKEFRAECRAYAQTWVNAQAGQLKRLGVNGDWDNPYLTMDFAAEATIVSELLKFATSGQLYRGAKPVMWSPVEKTALAEAEVEYEDVTSTQIDVAFEIVESKVPELVGAYAVIWTTTPWTIPTNQAIAYGAEVEYVLVRGTLTASQWDGQAEPDVSDSLQFNGMHFVVAAPLVGALASRISGKHARLSLSEKLRFTGADLAGTFVRHPMAKAFPDSPFLAAKRPLLDGSAFVTTDAGTGLVHMAPDHGEDDFILCKAHGIDPVFAVGADGRYREDWPWVGGLPFSVIDKKLNDPQGPICAALSETGALLSVRNDESTKHSYPHSWRSKAKVIYRCTPQWFVPMDRPKADGETLRETAMRAIADTRWVPEKGRNRIGSMVEGRPDWVLSRQRAWGVPITLFVDRKTGQYLNDAAVNARIVAAIRESGVDAWEDARAQEYLGADYKAEDYERVVDILDVWFDSGSTHAFVLESGRWPDLTRPEGYVGPLADLYLEGSDQHRGWFQSSLLEACATRGHAPYKGVLTHGFTMDAKGMKMSKSLGNTVDPLKVMETYGADIVRLWALSVDYTEDHRIGDEILKGIADQYRKLRNTFRYLLGALEGFSEAEQVDVAAMPELERYMLALLARLDGTLRGAIEAYDFNTYVRALIDFCNEDLSAFFFDIRKDCLYCDAVGDPKRRAYRTVLDILFHALVRYAAPVLVFTAEEVWGTRFPEAGSVHLLTLVEVDAGWDNPAFYDTFAPAKQIRSDINGVIEHFRREGLLGSSLGAEVVIYSQKGLPSRFANIDLAELCIVSRLRWVAEDVPHDAFPFKDHLTGGNQPNVGFKVFGAMYQVQGERHSGYHKCGRCWRHLPEVADDGDLCGRCESVVNG